MNSLFYLLIIRIALAILYNKAGKDLIYTKGAIIWIKTYMYISWE